VKLLKSFSCPVRERQNGGLERLSPGGYAGGATVCEWFVRLSGGVTGERQGSPPPTSSSYFLKQCDAYKRNFSISSKASRSDLRFTIDIARKTVFIFRCYSEIPNFTLRTGILDDDQWIPCSDSALDYPCVEDARHCGGRYQSTRVKSTWVLSTRERGRVNLPEHRRPRSSCHPEVHYNTQNCEEGTIGPSQSNSWGAGAERNYQAHMQSWERRFRRELRLNHNPNNSNPRRRCPYRPSPRDNKGCY
jgi:hypothetical protein